jgi:hypothetical protein
MVAYDQKIPSVFSHISPGGRFQFVIYCLIVSLLRDFEKRSTTQHPMMLQQQHDDDDSEHEEDCCCTSTGIISVHLAPYNHPTLVQSFSSILIIHDSIIRKNGKKKNLFVSSSSNIPILVRRRRISSCTLLQLQAHALTTAFEWLAEERQGGGGGGGRGCCCC